MDVSPIQFFDLDSKTHEPYSPRTWAIRLLLNYKGIPYNTTWLAFTDIPFALERAGVPRTRPRVPFYTVPAIIDPNPDPSTPVTVADTRKIAAYIEQTYKTLPVPLLDEMRAKEMMDLLMMPIWPLVVPQQLHRLLERDVEYYVQSRKKMAGGKELHEICPPEKREEMIRELEDALTRLAEHVGTPPNEAGWVYGEKEPTFLDFELLGMLLWLKSAGYPEVWPRISEANEGKWGKLFIAAGPYMAAVL